RRGPQQVIWLPIGVIRQGRADEHGIRREVRAREIDRAGRSVVAHIHALREGTAGIAERLDERRTAGGIDPDWAVDQRLLRTQNRRSEAETAHRDKGAQAARQTSIWVHGAAQRQASVMTALSAFT